MKKTTKVLSFLLAGFMAVGMTACSSGSSASSSSQASSSAAGSSSEGSSSAASNGVIDKIKADGFITMSTNAEFPPFEYLEGTEFKGIDVEISKKIAEKLGVELKINNTSFDSLPLELEKEKCNFVTAGMTIDPEKKISFSDPYFDASQTIIVLKDSTIKSAADLEGKRIGVQLGTTGDTYCTKNVKDAQISRMNKGMDAVADLVKGSLDAVVIDDYPARKLTEKNADKVMILEEALTVEQYGIAVKKGNQELLDVINEVLSEMKASGDLDKLIDEYSGDSVQ